MPLANLKILMLLAKMKILMLLANMKVPKQKLLSLKKLI